MVANARTLFCILFLAILLLIPLTLIYAQTPDVSIEGTVLDSAGTPAAAVPVTAVNSATGWSKSAASGKDGYYRLFGLQPGTYDLTASSEGTGIATLEGIALHIGQNRVADFRLRPPQQMVEVNVVATAPQIEIKSQSDLVLTQRDLPQLPINGRNFQQLAVLAPGVTTGVGIDPTKTRVGAISISGGDGRRVNYRVDGGDNNDDIVGSALQQYSLEAIQEFDVVTDLYKAENGYGTEGLINAVTKSGTNRLTGSAFAFFRHNELNSRTYFEKQSNLSKAKFNRRHLGFTLGGPIILDKLHYFVSFEQQDQNEYSVFTTGGVFPSLETTIAQPFRQTLPLVKLTSQLGAHSSALRLAGDFEVEKGTGADGRSAPEATGITHNTYWSVLASDKWAIGSNKLNEFTFQTNYFLNKIDPAASEYDFTVQTPSANFFRYGGATQRTHQKKFQFRDDFSWEVPTSIGRHLFKTGAEWMFEPRPGMDLNFYQNYFVYDTDSAVTIVNGHARPRPYSEVRPVYFSTLLGWGHGYKKQVNFYSTFVQDDWTLSRRLTLNLGLRYELQTGIWREYNVPGEDSLRATGYQGRGPFDDKNNLGPRIGFVYVLNENRTTLRGGYGRYFDRAMFENSYSGQFMETNPPSMLPIGILNPTFGPLEIPDTLSVSPTSPNVKQETQDARNQNPQADEFSLGISHTILADLLASVSFTHTKWSYIPIYRMINHLNASGQRVLFPTMGDFGYVSTVGGGTNDAIKVSFSQRFSEKYWLSASYTLDWRNTTPALQYYIPLNQDDPAGSGEHGPTLNYEKHRLVLSGSAELPGKFTLSCILQWASARPYTATTANDINGDGVIGWPGDRVGSYNSRRGSNFFSLDPRISKEFSFDRGGRLEVILEVFNVTNRSNFGGFYNGNLDSPGFGTPVQLLGPPRQAQIGVRYSY